jgi:hypothetical protein
MRLEARVVYIPEYHMCQELRMEGFHHSDLSPRYALQLIAITLLLRAAFCCLRASPSFLDAPMRHVPFRCTRFESGIQTLAPSGNTYPRPSRVAVHISTSFRPATCTFPGRYVLDLFGRKAIRRGMQPLLTGEHETWIKARKREWVIPKWTSWALGGLSGLSSLTSGMNVVIQDTCRVHH